jgi:hypothetical protein
MHCTILIKKYDNQKMETSDFISDAFQKTTQNNASRTKVRFLNTLVTVSHEISKSITSTSKITNSVKFSYLHATL